MMTNSEALHPHHFVPREWTVSSQSTKSGALTVEYHVEPADELSIPALTHHYMTFSLKTGSTRQVTRIGKDEYDGLQPAGTLWLAAANDTPCSWVWNGTDTTIAFLVDPLGLQEVAAEIGMTASSEIDLRHTTCEKDAQIERIARQFLAEMQQKGVGQQLFTESLSNLFMLHLLRHYTHQPPKLLRKPAGLDDKRMKRVIDYMNSNIGNSISLNELALVAGLSKFHFSRSFKIAIGVAPYQYLMKIRIDRAACALRKGQKSIAQIAADCGFSDQSHFTRNFKVAKGVTPKEFRQKK